MFKGIHNKENEFKNIFERKSIHEPPVPPNEMKLLLNPKEVIEILRTQN